MIPHIDHPCPPYTVSTNGFNGPPSVSGQRKHAADDFSQDKEGNRMPSGADLLMPMETGIVTIAGWVDGNTGFMIAIYDAESGLQCRMLHLKDVLVTVGQRPSQRELIGHCNSTGLSYGTHLHFACWFDTLEQALQVQADPEPVYGKWAVDPQLLLRKQEEDMKPKFWVARPSGRCYLVDAWGKHYIRSLTELGFWIQELGRPEDKDDTWVDQFRGQPGEP